MKQILRILVFILGLILFRFHFNMDLPMIFSENSPAWWVYILDMLIFLSGFLCFSFYLTGKWFYVDSGK